jgi:DNA-binding beta-propeller fold protein YncE
LFITANRLDARNYLDSIYEDEEGKKLFLPSFVTTEPVMKEIYIIDGRGRIIIYTSDLFPVHTLSKKDGIESPQSLTVDAEGNVYVIQTAIGENLRYRVSVFNARLKWERDIYWERFDGSDSFEPNRIARDKKGNIYISGTYFPGILIMDDKGRLLEIMSHEERGRKVQLNIVSIDEAGKIYLVSEEEGNVYVYDENKKFLFKFGEKGGSSGKLSRPKGIAVDNNNGNIYVADYMRFTILAYDNTGKYLYEFGGMGWGEGWFQYPMDVAVDSTGRILVADLFNHRIQIFNP